MMSIQCNSIFFCSSGFDCSEEVVDYLKTHRKNEEEKPYNLFEGNRCSYLNEMHLNGTYGDHITLDLISQMYNVHIQVMSLLGLQATININQQTGWQTMVLGHFVKGQGDHIC